METDRLVRKAGKTFTTWRPWLSIKPSANLAGLLALPCRIAEFSCVPPHNEEEKTVDPDELSTTNTKLLNSNFWQMVIYIYMIIYEYIIIYTRSIHKVSWYEHTSNNITLHIITWHNIILDMGFVLNSFTSENGLGQSLRKSHAYLVRPQHKAPFYFGWSSSHPKSYGLMLSGHAGCNQIWARLGVNDTKGLVRTWCETCASNFRP